MSTDTTFILVAIIVAAIIIYLLERLHEHLKDNNAKRAFQFGAGAVLVVLLVLFLLYNFMTEDLDQNDEPLQGSIALEKPATEDLTSALPLLGHDNEIPRGKPRGTSTKNINPSVAASSEVVPLRENKHDNNSADPALQSVAKQSRANLPVEEIDQSPTGTDIIGAIIKNQRLSTDFLPQQTGVESQTSETDKLLLVTETANPVSTSLMEEITVFLNSWSKAWENTAGAQGDMETFSTFYAQAFSRGNTSRSSWLADKASKNRRKSWIKVSFSDLKIELHQDEKTISASFLQDYSSSNYSQKSLKTFLLKKEIDNWQIISVKDIADFTNTNRH